MFTAGCRYRIYSSIIRGLRCERIIYEVGYLPLEWFWDCGQISPGFVLQGRAEYSLGAREPLFSVRCHVLFQHSPLPLCILRATKIGSRDIHIVFDSFICEIKETNVINIYLLLSNTGSTSAFRLLLLFSHLALPFISLGVNKRPSPCLLFLVLAEAVRLAIAFPVSSIWSLTST